MVLRVNLLKSSCILYSKTILKVLRAGAFVKRNNFQNLRLFSMLFGGIVTQNYFSRNYIRSEEIPQKVDKPKSELETFSQELYQKYINENYDIIIFYHPDRFMESFQEEVLNLVKKLQQLSNLKPKSRKLKVLKMNELSAEEQKKFEEKYGCYIEYDTILLLKNKLISAMNAYGAQEYFENKDYLVKYFEKLNKIKADNYENFRSLLQYLPDDNTVILLKAQKGQNSYKNLQRRFAIIQLQQNYSKNQNIHWFVIDDETANKLGIVEPKDGQMYFLLKSQLKFNNKFNFTSDNKKFLITKASSLANMRVQDVIEENSQKFNEVSIFASRSFELANPKYSMILECDLNKLPRQDLKRLIKVFIQYLFNKLFISFKEKLQKDDSLKENLIEFIHVNRHIEQPGAKYRIYLRDEKKCLDKTNEHSITSIEETKKLSTFNDFNTPNTYTYLLKQNASLESLSDFLTQVQTNQMPQYFKSQSKAKYQKYSVKLCGKNFNQKIIQNPTTSVIFHYSKNCHACKSYGKDYEELALEYLKKGDPVQFGRINNDRNQIDCSINFSYTPVFSVLKADAKDKPYVYRHQKFTPDLLKQFVGITSSFSLIDEKVFKNIQNDIDKFIQKI